MKVTSRMDQLKQQWPSDGEVVIKVHAFFVAGSYEDPDIVAAEPMYEWIHTDAGEWANAYSLTPIEWHRQFDSNTYGYMYVVTAKFTKQDYVFWKLKYG